ncbi:hypothetical protein K470DRAFT_280173 [Piedraia hortae CBS 480.64]|uniref:FAD-binding domain-containing protein n=1 Tax=Piedraia hortae CBS 480.64 TaxID=1314780 RepID=A0A6A7C7Z3_9PEZI|nr:hypothetical protein K470DRAFT_280173 [Piedraia hortae CBS 480.64]
MDILVNPGNPIKPAEPAIRAEDINDDDGKEQDHHTGNATSNEPSGSHTSDEPRTQLPTDTFTSSLPAPNSQPHDSKIALETPYLIIGSGPAGASLACFLSSNNLHGVLLSSADGPAREPRAHITSPSTLECLRDIDLSCEAVKASSPGRYLETIRWCHDLVGIEYGRARSWQNHPSTLSDLNLTTPCEFIDLPQSLLEPILLRRATSTGWKLRFNTAFLHFERREEGFVSEVYDSMLQQRYKIKSKYLFGCDGSGSRLVAQLALPLRQGPEAGGQAANILVEANLAKHMPNREAFLHWIIQPEQDVPIWGRLTIARMVRPWDLWMFIIILPPGGGEVPLPSDEEFLGYIARWIGDESVPVKILQRSRWRVNDVVAERYDDGGRRVFALGNAVHRHPPHNALGSNTCIQDAFNLAWKVAYVEKGFAGERLLDSYTSERQPVGERIVKKSNLTAREIFKAVRNLGILHEDVEVRRRQIGKFAAPTKEGREMRLRLQGFLDTSFAEIGNHMNQRYVSGAVVRRDEKDEPEEWSSEEWAQHVLRSTYPGHKLPHAEGKISTLDLAGHGAFCVITGIGGEAWKAAAEDIGKKLGIPFSAYSIGFGQDWEDSWGDWARVREIEESGCLLCRPDRTIAWRSMEVSENAADRLMSAVKTVLGIGGGNQGASPPS